jgi:hypothetical protein
MNKINFKSMKLSLRYTRTRYTIAMNTRICCLKALVFVMSFGLLGQKAFSQSTSYHLTPKANAFMCPFLTPIFMKELTEAGAEELIKDDHLVIHFTVPTGASLDSAEVYRIAGEVGFQSKIFTLQKTRE